MTYDPEKHHRHAMRYKGHDYRTPGIYFVTTCSWKRLPLFDSLELREMLIATWQQLPGRFPSVRVDLLVVMPNHIHGLLWLDQPKKGNPSPSLSSVMRVYKSIAAVTWIRMNKERRQQHPGHLWQERFYDHIVRNEDDLQRIREYVMNNPLNALVRKGEEIDDTTWEKMVRDYIEGCLDSL